ncbi:glycosyltransferase [Chryseomicrobium palamuruense]|uniref:Glycosyltransferase n=1 Tax=Chryseomicrobium palamuruense TaxID=682973 RepID=A0ABV8UXC2_9BACL
MEWTLWFSYILLSFVVITLVHSLLLPNLSKIRRIEGVPLVSVLVPMRNEVRNVKGMVDSVKKQTYKHIEVFFLDDESTDGTSSALELAVRGDARFKVLQGKPKPEKWIGKVFACHQLSEAAKGDYLLFLDADVRIQPEAVERALGLMQQKNISLLSGFSRFILPTWLNKLLVPLQHFFVLFHLPILLANWTKWPPATAAHGGFMFFERSAYQAIGGHAVVKENIVEDVAISKRMKAEGYRMWIANITSVASCRMYETNAEVWQGFTKNIFNGIGRSIPLAVGIILFYGVVYVGSGILALAALLVEERVLLLPYLLIILQAGIVYLNTREPLALAFLLPVASVAFILLLVSAMRKSVKGQQVEWKGRYYG